FDLFPPQANPHNPSNPCYKKTPILRRTALQAVTSYRAILKQQSILVVFEEKHYKRLSTEGFIYPLQSISCNLSFHAIDNH
ncbi:MAG: hypothetical protein PUD84_06080, partial [Paraprevotella sp.]|nr:hypothetical protein [Paraprevotella sp.]